MAPPPQTAERPMVPTAWTAAMMGIGDGMTMRHGRMGAAACGGTCMVRRTDADKDRQGQPPRGIGRPLAMFDGLIPIMTAPLAPRSMMPPAMRCARGGETAGRASSR